MENESTVKTNTIEKFGFTIARLERLEPRARDYYLSDADCKQLSIRIKPDKSKSLVFKTKYLGRQYYDKICDFTPSVNIEEVRRIAMQKYLDVTNGIAPNKRKQERKECLTLGEVMAWYLEHKKVSRPKSVHQSERLFNTYLKPLANRKLVDISPNDLRQKIATPLELRAKFRQSNQAIQFVSRLYNYAANFHGYKGDSPCKNWEYNPEEPADKFMDPETLFKFIEEVKKDKDSDIRDLFLLLCYLGNRVAATHKMTFSSLDFDQKTWSIPRINSKNNESMVISLNAKAIEILKNRRESRTGDNVFAQTRNDDAFRWWYKKGFKEICKRAGITGFYTHAIRKSCGAYMISVLEMPLYEVGKALGHKKHKTTERSYSKLFDKKRQQNAERFGDSLP